MKKTLTRRWCEKGYAIQLMRELMRTWAKAKRAAAAAPQRSALEHEELIAFGQMLGARRALRSSDMLTVEQYGRICARTSRIIRSRIIRRPLAELRRAA